MASDRMMQAIATLERAIGRLEQTVVRSMAARTMVAHNKETGSAETVPSPDPSPDIDRMAARAALRSLDDLIAELKGRSHG